ncbi:MULTISPECIES: prephenate dehydratase [Sphingomonas]|uniref:prephenate dehydratase n=1 Tax=Sphingomonas lycopersici TaxID=2951807 RepID=A0AA41Z7R4_9SPHN|nr:MULTISPECIES: prephenate dehydratase [Sphingomonas]MCW6531167.1 prephenate dehydratase [Sphingomonas lycopersici]MCW6535545.1 prephenate dehydratase [Sphingomonas lycopersici]OJU14698.1 MAG: prephenate dehydratase [Sphingomonas sp. 66-10]
MENFAAPARPIVAAMTAAAAADPERAVAFQGAPGANSHVAAREAFPDGLPLPCFAFEDAIDAVKEGRAAHAIIPIENSLHGRVADIHFLLPESGLVITGEHFLPIRYALMGLGTRDEVREAMSHPQALGQCRHWLKAHDIQPLAYPDTAGAAAMVAEIGEATTAALAPPPAADIYGLKLLANDIADADHNTTRFVILARGGRPAVGDGPWMTTFIFEVKNIPAALYKAMGGFATNGVNMTKLESYQRGGSFAATEFYADVVGRPGDEAFDRAMEELGFHSKWLRVLGTYKQARERG